MIDHGREAKFLTASKSDMELYESMLPVDHKLCQIVDAVDFEIFRPVVESGYSKIGQPTGYAMISYKLEVLKYFYNLSDRAVIERANTDVAFRWFLKLPIREMLSDHTLLNRFRGRMGSETYQKLFHQLIASARSRGIVKDQLRLKDATHIIANISIPSTIALVSQVRERLLHLLDRFDGEAAAGYRVAVETMRDQTKESGDALRLNQRIELLDTIVSDLGKRIEEDTIPKENLAKIRECVDLATKILSQKKSEKTTREIRSLADPEAMRGKHGAFYDGYVMDVMLDADSELITAIDVLQAGGDEAQGAIALLDQERSAHGNAPKELSIDGAGHNGEMIRKLEGNDENGVTVFVPPKSARSDVQIAADQFEVVQTEERGQQVRCPEGKTSQYSQRDGDGTTYRFTKATCKECPLVQQCCKKIGTSPFGRSVRKNDYQEEYDRVRSRSQTARFDEVRRLHPSIERKINECANHNGGRHARYRGREKVRQQIFGVGLAVNLKRLAKIIRGQRAQKAAPTPTMACC